MKRTVSVPDIGELLKKNTFFDPVQSPEPAENPSLVLARAARSNDVETARELLNAHDDIVVCGVPPEGENWPALFHAAAGGCVDVLSLFLEEVPELDLGYKTPSGSTVWHAAVLSNDVATLELLMEAGAPLSGLDNAWGSSPLEVAVGANSDEAVSWIFSLPGVLPSTLCVAPDPESGRTMLHVGAGAGAAESLKIIMKGVLAAANAAGVCASQALGPRDQTGATPMHEAASKGAVVCVKALLSAGASPDPAPVAQSDSAVFFSSDTTPSIVANSPGSATSITATRGRVQAMSAGPSQSSFFDGLMSSTTSLARTSIRSSASFASGPLYSARSAGTAADWSMTESPMPSELSGQSPRSEGPPMVENSPLWAAAAAGAIATVKVLIVAGANPNGWHGARETPLHAAVRAGSVSVVSTLCNADANVNAVNDSGLPALVLAAHTGRGVVVRELLEAGAPVAQLQEDGADWKEEVQDAVAAWNPNGPRASSRLVVAARLKAVGRVEALLAAGVPANARTRNGQSTALAEALIVGSAPIARMLLANGAPLPTPAAPWHRGALYHAASSGDVPSVSLVIDALRDGVEAALESKGSLTTNDEIEAALAHAVNAEDYQGSTALHEAAWIGSAGVIEVLVRAGAEVNARTTRIPGGGGRTPLHYAAMGGHGSAILALLASGAEVDLEDGAGASPLCRAVGAVDRGGGAAAARGAAVSTLIRAGASLGPSSSAPGWSPLHYACISTSARYIGMLARAGADVNAPAEVDGCRPLHHAVIARYGASVDSLVRRPGIDLWACNDDGLTAAQLANVTGWAAGLEFLRAHAQALITLTEAVERGSVEELEAALRIRGSAISSVASGPAVPSTEVAGRPVIANLDAPGPNGHTPLYCAAAAGFTSGIALLLGAGASVNARCLCCRRTALHAAGSAGAVRAWAALMDAGADAHAPDADGKTPSELLASARNNARGRSTPNSSPLESPGEMARAVRRRAAALDLEGLEMGATRSSRMVMRTGSVTPKVAEAIASPSSPAGSLKMGSSGVVRRGERA